MDDEIGVSWDEWKDIRELCSVKAKQSREDAIAIVEGKNWKVRNGKKYQGLLAEIDYYCCNKDKYQLTWALDEKGEHIDFSDITRSKLIDVSTTHKYKVYNLDQYDENSLLALRNIGIDWKESPCSFTEVEVEELKKYLEQLNDLGREIRKIGSENCEKSDIEIWKNMLNEYEKNPLKEFYLIEVMNIKGLLQRYNRKLLSKEEIFSQIRDYAMLIYRSKEEQIDEMILKSISNGVYESGITINLDEMEIRKYGFVILEDESLNLVSGTLYFKIIINRFGEKLSESEWQKSGIEIWVPSPTTDEIEFQEENFYEYLEYFSEEIHEHGGRTSWDKSRYLMNRYKSNILYSQTDDNVVIIGFYSEELDDYWVKPEFNKEIKSLLGMYGY